MKKLSVLCFVGGTEDGFDNGAGSEQRYIFGLAEMLASFGHEVVCAGSNHGGWGPPQWGDQKPIPNITFIHLSTLDLSKLQFDVAIISENIVHWRREGVPVETPCTDFDQVAKVIGHPLFGWAGTNLPCAEHRDDSNRHWVIQPFKPMNGKSFPADIVINYPVFNRPPEIIPATRDTIVWSCKDVYHDDWKEDKPFHFSGMRILRSMAELSRTHGIYSSFISSEWFVGKRAKRLGADKLFYSINNTRPYQKLIRKSVLDSEFNRARLSIILEGYFSSAFSAPAAGAVPLYFMGDNGNIWHPQQKILNPGWSDLELTRQLEKFFIDDNFYKQQIDICLNTISKLSFEKSHKTFLNFVEKVGLA